MQGVQPLSWFAGCRGHSRSAQVQKSVLFVLIVPFQSNASIPRGPSSAQVGNACGNEPERSLSVPGREPGREEMAGHLNYYFHSWTVLGIWSLWTIPVKGGKKGNENVHKHQVPTNINENTKGKGTGGGRRGTPKGSRRTEGHPGRLPGLPAPPLPARESDRACRPGASNALYILAAASRQWCGKQYGERCNVHLFSKDRKYLTWRRREGKMEEVGKTVE